MATAAHNNCSSVMVSSVMGGLFPAGDLDALQLQEKRNAKRAGDISDRTTDTRHNKMRLSLSSL